MRGRVTEFDEARGLGTITSDDGRVHPFHCTQITDGSRQIEPGAAVRFELLPKLGRYEAGSIEKLAVDTA
jgi:cold shock CspA family protein